MQSSNGSPSEHELFRLQKLKSITRQPDEGDCYPLSNSRLQGGRCSSGLADRRRFSASEKLAPSARQFGRTEYPRSVADGLGAAWGGDAWSPGLVKRNVPSACSHSTDRFDGGTRTTASTPATRDDRLTVQKSRLTEISEHLSGVEKRLEDRTVATVQAETSRLHAFNDSVVALERKVHQECQERAESHKMILTTLQQHLEQVFDHLEAVLVDRMQKVGDLLGSMESRIDGLEGTIQGLEEDCKEAELEKKIADAGEELSAFREELPVITQRRQELFLEKLDAAQNAILARFEEERSKRLRQIRDMKEESENAQQIQSRSAREIENQLFSYRQNLENQIAAERQSREQADEEIVLALQSFCKATSAITSLV